MRIVQPDGLSNFTSSLERTVKGDDFISVILLASSKIFALLGLIVSTSSRKGNEGQRKFVRKIWVFTHHHIGIIDGQTIFIATHLSTFRR